MSTANFNAVMAFDGVARAVQKTAKDIHSSFASNVMNMYVKQKPSLFSEFLL